VQWKNWLPFAWRHQLKLIWPNHIICPGPGFDLKKLSALELKQLVEDYMENVRDPGANKATPQVVAWTEGKVQLFYVTLIKYNTVTFLR
jgi:hypothetical protein